MVSNEKHLTSRRHLYNICELAEVKTNPHVPVLPMHLVSSYLDQRIQDLSQERIFIHIAGTSGSGKTTVAQMIVRELAQRYDVKHFDMDVYLAEDLKERISHEPPTPGQPYLCGINPACFNLEEITRDLKKLRRGEAIQIPTYDRAHNKRTGYELYKPARIIVVEGLHALDGPIMDENSIGCLVASDLHSRLKRKLIRTLIINKRGSLDQIVSEYLTSMEPGYRYHMKDLVAKSEIVIDNSGTANLDITPIAHDDSSIVGSAVIPKEGVGKLESCEKIQICPVQEAGAVVRFLYRYNDKLILNEPISEETLARIMQYYEFKKDSSE